MEQPTAQTMPKRKGTIETPTKRGRRRAEGIHALVGAAPVVYALRLTDGTIKIGHTSDLAARRRHYVGSEIIAFVVGEYDDEQAIHASLTAHRARAVEYYHPTPAVMAVVNQMRDTYNLPHIAA